MALFAVYAATAYAAIIISQATANVAALWPPNGIALAILLSLRDRRDWPVHAAAAALGNIAANLIHGDTIGVTLGFTACNMSEILLAYGLLRQAGIGGDILRSVRLLFSYFAIAGVAAAVAATFGAAMVAIAFGGTYGTVWRTWWIGDAVGLLILTPLLLAWGRGRLRPPPAVRIAARDLIVAGILALAIILVFHSRVAQSAIGERMSVLILPLQVWAAHRFGPRGAASANAFIAVVGIVAILHGAGILAAVGDPAEAITALQLLLAATGITALVLSVALAETRRAQVHLRAAVDGMREGFVLYDADDRLVTCNRQCEEIYGHPAGSLKAGDHFADIIRRDTGMIDELSEAWVAERLQTRDLESSETEQRLRDGRWLLVSDRRTADGGRVGIRTDITRLKQQEQELRDKQARLIAAEERARTAEARLQDAIESVDAGITLFDADDRLALYNQRMTELYPRSARHWVAGASYERILRLGIEMDEIDIGDKAPDDWIATAIAAHRACGAPHEYRLPDGRWLHLIERRTSDGGIVGVRMDITSLKNKQVQLHESEDRFRTVVEGSPTALIMLDPAARITLVNGQAETIFGYRREELIGQPVELLIPERARQTHPTLRADYLAAPSARPMGGGRDLHARRKDGSEFPVEIALNPIPAVGGTIILSAITDISARKQAEAQINQYQRQEAIGQLTGGVAHEFNNLLMIVMGNAEMLADSVRGIKPAAAIAERIVLASRHGAKLTQQLLAFSRRQPLRPEVLDVGSTLQTLHSLARTAVPETIDIDISTLPGVQRINADKLQLENAILNLVFNARDAMSAGGRLLIRTRAIAVAGKDRMARRHLTAGDYVAIEVVDTGQGMSAEVLARATEPFFTTKSVADGTGLGLSMVQGFCRQSGGDLEIESKQGFGTTARMLLPRAQPNTEAGEVATAVPRAPSGDIVVLVVEDESVLLQTAAASIRSFGYRVIGALDGSTALEAINRAERIDVLFADVVLPHGMSGPELAQIAVGRRPGLQVVFTSGYNDGVVPHGEGVVVLRKPCKRLELAHALWTAAEAHPRPPAARELAAG